MIDDLPEGWADSPLAEVVYFAGRIGWRGLKAEEYTKSGAILLSVHNLNNGPNVVFTNVNYVSMERYEESPEIKVSVNDVLLTKDGAGIGKSGFVASLPAVATINSSLLLLRSLGALHPKFLFYSVIGPRMQRLVQERITGSTTPHLFQKDIKHFELLIPPLTEEQRIVAKVEALLARVNAARQRLAKVPAILKRFRQSVLASACSGRLTGDWREGQVGLEPASELLTRLCNGRKSSATPERDELPELPEAWAWASPPAVATEIVDCPHSTPRWADSGRICLRTTNFRPGLLDLSEVRHVSEAIYQGRIARLEPKAGDVVYSREGGILGIACMIPPGLTACLGQRMMLFRVDRSCSPEYFMHVLNSRLTIKRVQDVTGGTASPHLNVGDIKLFPVPLPPTEEQHEIVRRVEALFRLADAIEKRVAVATARAEKLTQSILAKAFRGELVPTEAELARREGRDYQPALVLLEQIRAHRTTSQTKPNRSK